MMGPNENEIASRLATLASAAEQSAPEMASAYKAMYDELLDAGFTEEQAIELMKEFNLSLGD